ncbi:MAG: MATE family efflux transporter [Parachlamydia sp.]|jgi:MATE family multidrug resistance protein|nr:MATE family efflux transporter [Parachlamydia sp.]
MHHSYQLTRHPIGSIKECWSISWPLMLGLLSSSLMMFTDRLMLARFSSDALNATIISGVAFYTIIILPLIIAGISEVFVGRYNGASEKEKTGGPVWQMIWLSFLFLPFFLLSGAFLPTLLFQGPLAEHETLYFKWALYFAPFFCSTVALMGFFIGIGKVKWVTYSAIFGNLVNIGVGIALIFGAGPIPALGIMGAALAMGIAQLAQTFFLGSLFLQKNFQKTYGTDRWRIQPPLFKEALIIGGPAGLNKCFELCAHLIFFKLLERAGLETMTLIGLSQSFYLLTGFLIEGLSKGVSGVISNLIGGNQFGLINKVIRSAMLMQTFLTTLLFGFVFFILLTNIQVFFPEQADLLQQPHIYTTFKMALGWMVLFFLLDGFGWIYAGFLTASGDTKFLLYAGLGLNWLAYVLPAYLIFTYTEWGNAANGWMLIAFYALATFMTYFYRFMSGKWKKALKTSSLELATV